MKHLVKYINEGIFNDNIKSAIKVHGLNIDEFIWGKCDDYFSVIKKTLKGKKVYDNSWNNTSYDIVYYGNDCIVLTDTDVSYDSWMYIICTEAIYMNYLTALNTGGNIDISKLDKYGIGFDEGFLNLAFAARISKFNKEWYYLEGCDKYQFIKDILDMGLPVSAYIPETISDKAKKVINSYMK